MFCLRIHSLDSLLPQPPPLESPQESEASSSNSSSISISIPNPPINNTNANDPRIQVIKGTIHLYRNGPHPLPSSSNFHSFSEPILPVGRGTLLFVLAVPNRLSTEDFLQFCGSVADLSSAIRVIRCESFSTYPRTYDLVHAWLLFSKIEKQGCSLEDLLIEMDRILRPRGLAIIRDKVPVINYIRRYLPALGWDGWSSEVEPTVDALSSGEDERVLILQKKLWEETPLVM